MLKIGDRAKYVNECDNGEDIPSQYTAEVGIVVAFLNQYEPKLLIETSFDDISTIKLDVPEEIAVHIADLHRA